MSRHARLIDWVDAKLRTWGYDRRRVRRAKYPPSPAGRLDEPIGYGAEPEPIEGLKGDALLVAVAIRRSLEDHTLQLKHHAALYLHYDDRFRRRPVKDKYRELGVTCPQGYYYLLSRAHHAIDAHWPTDLERRVLDNV